MSTLIDKLVGDLAAKRRWREYKARAAALPAPYRDAVKAIERYTMHTGIGISSDSDVLIQMVNDLAELFEQSAADGIPVRAVVGDDPVAFVEAFLANYGDDSWLDKERTRFVDAINAATEDRPAR